MKKRLRRLLAIAPLVAVALSGTAAAVLPPGPRDPAARPQALPALTGPALFARALSARYMADARAVTTADRAAATRGDAQLASELTALRGRRLLFFDPRGQGLAGAVFGDLAAARRVVIIVPGTDTTLSDFSPVGTALSRGTSSPAGAAAALAAQTRAFRPGAHLAVIAWLGYATPSMLSTAVLTSGAATQGAASLRPLVAALATAGKQVVLICHSYGSVVCGLAAPGLPVTDIAVVGSPGMDASSAESLHTRARTWAGRDAGDLIRDVPHVRLLGLGFGADPVSPGFGARPFATGDGGHSDYFKPGSVSLRNLAWIALGDPAKVTR